jgi:cephalosporin hydroxylase
MSYREIVGWCDFEDIYTEAVQGAPLRSSLVEVGVAAGRSLAFLARQAINHGRDDLMIFGVDVWMAPASDADPAYLELLQEHGGEHGDPYLAFLWSMQTHAPEELKRVRVLRADSASVAGLGPRPWFVFIDGDHSFEGVARDIQAWKKAVLPGGILAGHDYYLESVAEAVRGNLGDVPRRGSSWFYKVPLTRTLGGLRPGDLL